MLSGLSPCEDFGGRNRSNGLEPWWWLTYALGFDEEGGSLVYP